MTASPHRASPVDAFRVALAARVLRQGGVVLHATEGVWGLACDAQDERAVERILCMKERPAHKGLIVIGDSPAVFAPELAALQSAQRSEVLRTWPGPVTWVLPDCRFGDLITGYRSEVAVRVPGHEQTRRLVRLAGMPLVSTSANRAGDPAPVDMLSAIRRMGCFVDHVLAGRTSGRGVASRIRRLDGSVLRG